MIIVLMLVLAGTFVAALVIGGPGFASVDTQTGSFSTVSTDVDGRPSFLQVQATRENAVTFGSDEGHVDGPNVSVDETWTVCAVAALDANANQNATYDVAGFENGTIQLEYADGNWSVWARNASGDTARSTVVASNPTTLTAMCGVSDGSGVTMHADGVTGENDPYDAAPENRRVSVDMYGTIDEVRVFDSVASSSSLSTYQSDPWAPLPSETRTSRYYLDEGSGTTTRVVFQTPNATLVGDTGWGSGVADPGLVNGSDFEVAFDPLRVQPLAGGQVEGAPLLFVQWSSNAYGAIVLQVADIGGTAFVLLAVGLLVIPVGAIVVMIRSSGLGDFFGSMSR